jgi:hypothetical protein
MSQSIAKHLVQLFGDFIGCNQPGLGRNPLRTKTLSEERSVTIAEQPVFGFAFVVVALRKATDYETGCCGLRALARSAIRE